MFPNIKIVEAIRKEYPAGTRIRLVKMDDIQAIAHQALQCTNPLITVSSIHINEFEFLLKKNGFTLYKKYENYYKQGIVEYAFNGLLPEKQNNCRMSQNVV